MLEGVTGIEALHAAVRSMDRAGRFPAASVPDLRAAVEALVASGLPLDHPAEVLGPWRELGADAQAALRGSAEAEIRRHMTWQPRGRVWPGLVRGLATTGRALPTSLGRTAQRWSGRLAQVPRKLRLGAHGRARLSAWNRGAAPTMVDLLAALGRSPRWLLADFATGVRVDPRARGFYHDRACNNVWGYVVGVDLLPTDEGVWCIEANLNTAYNDMRHEILNPEPAVGVVYDAAAEMGAKNVVWFGMDWASIPPWLVRELEDGARSAGVNVDVRQDYRVPRRADLPEGFRPPRPRLTSPTDLGSDTLVVRRNSSGVATDYLLGNKEPFIRGVHARLEASGDRRVRVPRMTRVPVELPRAEEGFPNLVYKYPASGQGKGVFFLRARDTDHAVSLAREVDQRTGKSPGLFQPFMCSRLLPGRRIYDVRVEMLITPLGVRHIFAMRREASRSLPERLGDGLVDGAGVFTSNVAAGGHFAPVGPEERDEVLQAGIAIGEALSAAFAATFETLG